MWIVAAAGVCGVIAFVGMIVSVSAYVHAPGIQSIPIIGVDRIPNISESATGSASKGQFLFAPELFLVILTLVVSYYALTRERFLVRGDRMQAAWAQFFPSMARINVRALIIAVCWLLCLVCGFNLWTLIDRASYVLSLT
jgi:hypothetical protein